MEILTKHPVGIRSTNPLSVISYVKTFYKGIIVFIAGRGEIFAKKWRRRRKKAAREVEHMNSDGGTGSVSDTL